MFLERCGLMSINLIRMIRNLKWGAVFCHSTSLTYRGLNLFPTALLNSKEPVCVGENFIAWAIQGRKYEAMLGLSRFLERRAPCPQAVGRQGSMRVLPKENRKSSSHHLQCHDPQAWLGFHAAVCAGCQLVLSIPSFLLTHLPPCSPP